MRRCRPARAARVGSQYRDARPAGRGKGYPGGAARAERGSCRGSRPGDILREAVQQGTPLGERRAGGDGRRAPGQRRRDDWHRRRSGWIAPTRAAGSCSTAFRARSCRRRRSIGWSTDRGPLVVLDIVVPEDVLVRRLATRRICAQCGSNAAVEWMTACGKCGGKLVARVDDGDDIVRERLKVYQRQTKPLVDYYSARGDVPLDRRQPAGGRRDRRRRRCRRRGGGSGRRTL